jgi:2-iminobutanoate/2-iminopropanoate deaminase
VFTSGQIALDPETGAMVEGGIGAQTRQVLENLRNVLEAAGTSMSRVVKTTVYMTNLGDFQKMNEIYAEHFPQEKPVRSTVGVASLPRGAMIEIDVVAQA